MLSRVGAIFGLSAVAGGAATGAPFVAAAAGSQLVPSTLTRYPFAPPKYNAVHGCI